MNRSESLASIHHPATNFLSSQEAKPVKYSIHEDEAENLASKLSTTVLGYFPQLDPDMVSQVVNKCVQERVQITEQVEMVSHISPMTNFVEWQRCGTISVGLWEGFV